ncbi:MAG: bifunctional adenosylcobinamide kinase/adenosylcobinamide-phosphate guanylyltransferase [Hyphomicrobiaceae bacterium]
MTGLPILPGRRGSLLVLGGSRSGKTRRALALGASFAVRSYVATAEALDAEMTERIALHQAQRGSDWRTIEAPLALADVLAQPAGNVANTVIVVDCLTLWLSNLMHHGREPEAETRRLVDAIRAAPASVVLVSNEVGFGIVPENALARRFRDAQGRLNQEIAAAVDAVELVAAGLPLRLK